MGRANRLWRYAAVLGVVWVLAGGVPSAVAGPNYRFDPTLSLTGDCTTSPVDAVPDPSCPYGAPPSGPIGPFAGPRAVAVDESGNVYVASYAEGSSSKGRVDIFDDEGKFIAEAAIPKVRSMAVDGQGNLYVFEVTSGTVVRYEPSKYDLPKGIIEYGNPPIVVSTAVFDLGAIAIDPTNDHLFEARPSTVIERGSAAESNAIIESYEPKGIGPWTDAIAVDAKRARIFLSFCENASTECGIKVVEATPPHSVVKTLDGSSTPAGKFVTGSGELTIAVDEDTGSFFVSDLVVKKIYRFDKDFNYLSEIKFAEFTGGTIAVSNGESADSCDYPEDVPVGAACNRRYLFVPAFLYPGRLAAYAESNESVPEIQKVSTGSISGSEGELRATIDPGGFETEYSFRITTQEGWEGEVEKFENAVTIPGGTISADSLSEEVSVFADGLTPGQTYRFRVVAKNILGPAGNEAQNEAVFATYDDAPVSLQCPNGTLRLASSAHLPDCRAYELVTPADTIGRPPRGAGFVGNVFTTIHSSPGGDSVSFKIEGGSLPGTSGVGSFEGDPYVSARGASGWTSVPAGVAGSETTVLTPGSTSPDQEYSFFTARNEGPLVISNSLGQKVNTEYLRYPDGTVELIGRGSLGSDPRAQGLFLTESATHIIFSTLNVTPDKAVPLEPDAPVAGTRTLYDRTIDPITGSEKTHVVSLLPGNITPSAGQDAAFRGISKDGEGVAFSIGSKLYLRVGNEITYEIGEDIEAVGVSRGGGRIFYVAGGDLEAFDTSAEEVIDFSSTGNVTPVNVSSEGSRAYFVSPSVLGGANPKGDVAQAGKQNLYLSEEGAISFVATVTERDVKGAETKDLIRYDGLGLLTEVRQQPARDPSRTNPNGSVLLFQSRAEITGYPASEFPQIYRYDSDAGDLTCISCIPTKQPATGGASLESYTFDSSSPRPFSPYGYVSNLNPLGTRVFFESTEALVSTDTDNVNDVYEWEAQDVGSCTRPTGCVYLISSGRSERDNFLYAHSTSGNDVFFTTDDKLTQFDTGGAKSLYDARVNGGFEESGQEGPCVGDSCRPTITPPMNLPTPQSSGQGRSGNVEPVTKTRPCPKGKRKVKKNGKVRCVKKKHKGGKAKNRANANREAGK